MSDADQHYDPTAPEARRYPRVIPDDEIAALPRWDLDGGVATTVFLSRERDDARYFRQGLYWLDADLAGYEWTQNNYDEALYCIEGLLRLRVRDSAGREVLLEAAPGENVYLPAATPMGSRPAASRPGCCGPAARRRGPVCAWPRARQSRAPRSTATR